MTTIKITLGSLLALGFASVAALTAGCSASDPNARAEGGAVDTTLGTAAVATRRAPGVRVTRTDGRSVSEAAVYRLTERNFGAFMSAAESLAALQRRDPEVRAYLDGHLDTGTAEAEAGRKWLIANAKARGAIEASGLTPSDYYVASICIANVERFLNHPKSVPMTPSLARNARLLQRHGRDLARLRALEAP